MRRVISTVILCLILAATLIAACGGEETPATPPTAPAQTSPISAAESPLSAAESPLAAPPKIAKGKAMVIGRLFSQGSGQPLGDVNVRLAEVQCPPDTKQEDKSAKCFWTLDNAFSPGTFTDANGNFAFVDVVARDYIILVGDLVTKHAFMNNADNKPVIITAPADEVTDVGDHQLDY
ncbi:MAG TPA: hypothetical protein PKE45_03545 [Caldilineaceae bacterium]|nr:hypothetical protein [Caldilineaceae bacterium]